MTTLHAKNQNGCKRYIAGFVASVILLLAVFALVKGQLLSTAGLCIAVSIFAIVEALILVFCFLLLNTSAEDRDWNTLAFLFTIVVMLVVVGGSLWIMYNLNYNMGSQVKFFTVTKPGIIFGNIVTLSGGFFLGSQGHINYLMWLITLVGMSLIIGSGCVFNNVIDKDIDGLMERTKDRALVLGLISDRTALLYAVTLALLGFGLLYSLANPLTLFFAALGFFVYVVVYSLVLKRRSTYSTIIGSVAGAVAPVIGYTAATNRVDLGALLLFLILLLWQMPHFYAISIYRMTDFKAASIPVLPLKRTMFYTKVSMLVYMLLFAIAAVLPTLFGYAGNIYFVVALLSSCYWLYLGLRGFKTDNDQRWAKQVFGFSIILITLLCVAMVFPW